MGQISGLGGFEVGKNMEFKCGAYFLTLLGACEPSQLT